jgi:hypothetical protein
VEKGKPVFFYSTANVHHATIASPAALGPGKHTLVLVFRYDGGVGKGGLATMKVDGERVAEGRIDRTLPYRISLDFTGHVDKVTIDLRWRERALRGESSVVYFASSIFLAASAPAFFISSFSPAPSAFTSTTTLRMVPVNLVLLGW